MHDHRVQTSLHPAVSHELQYGILRTCHNLLLLLLLAVLQVLSVNRHHRTVSVGLSLATPVPVVRLESAVEEAYGKYLDCVCTVPL